MPLGEGGGGGGGGGGVCVCVCVWGGGGSFPEKVPLVEFMYLVFTRMPGESYRRRLRSLCCCACLTSFER